MIFPVHIGAFGGIIGYHPLLEAKIAYAVANSISVPPTAWLEAEDTFIRAVMAYNSGAASTNLGALKLYSGDASYPEFSTINIMRNAYHSTLISSPERVAKKGFKRGAGTGYINSGFNPYQNSYMPQGNSMVWLAYHDVVNTGVANIQSILGVSQTAALNQIRVQIPRAATQYGAVLQANTIDQDTPTTWAADGTYAVLRNNGTQQLVYENGALKVTESENQTAEANNPNGNIFELVYNLLGTGAAGPVGTTIGAVAYGIADAGLIPVLHSAYQTYLSDISGL